LGTDGNFYGTTEVGGTNSDGTVFKISPAGTLTTLASFNGTNGANPAAALVEGSDGNFYGTTSTNETVFQTTPTGLLTTLFTATNEVNPSSLVQGTDGNFYGTTVSGGSGAGTVFKLTPAGVMTTLVSFNGTNGQSPQAALVLGRDGNFYGTTESGGGDNAGTVFRMTPAGVMTTLVSFNGTNGATPWAALVQGSDGNFYGTTEEGGSAEEGTLFMMTSTGIITTLVSFDGANGSRPGTALVQGSDGNFYGTTASGGSSNDGVIFQFVLPPTVAAPVFSPAAGTYSSAQTVTVTSATNGASVAYTTDGSTPAESGGTVTHGSLLSNGGSVAVGGTSTLVALAFKTGLADSAVVTSVYSLNLPGVVSAPTFNPAPGTYPTTQTVTITSVTSGASIAYTTDGSMPTVSGGIVTHGTLYSSAVSVGNNETIKAIAFENGLANSTVAAGAYAIQAAVPTFGTYSGNVVVTTIFSSTSGASIAYTTDGSTPTESGGTVTHGLLYSGAVYPIATTTINAIAFDSGLADSAVASNVYTIETPLPQVAPPTFGPTAGTYANAQSVTLATTTSGATIAYTTDGSTPAESAGTITHGIFYSGAVTISATGTLTAIAFETGYADSTATSGLYTIGTPPPQVAAPAFTPSAGTYGSAQNVTITSATNGATIRYTVDGSTPSESNGFIYSGPVSTIGTTILKAIAYKGGFTDSPATKGLYTILSSLHDCVNVLYDCNSANSGVSGVNCLVQGSDGNFYGTASYGGSSSNDGAVFKLTPTGTLTVLASFNGANGVDPNSLVQGTDGYFYGTTAKGGSGNFGTVFRMTSTGVLTTLVSFNGTNGVGVTSLVQGTDGNFYGASGGGSFDDGVIFKMTPSGTLTTLVVFNGANGSGPATPVLGGDGNFYGVTNDLGQGSSTVYEMTPAGVLSTLGSYASMSGLDGLVQGSDGSFYGTTFAGGNSDAGTVFNVTSAGVLTILYSFDQSVPDSNPDSKLVKGNDGNFYGTSVGEADVDQIMGSIFMVTPGGVVTTIATFDQAYGGESSGLLQGRDGNFYASSSGGLYGQGTLYQLIVPPIASPPTFSPGAGSYTSAQAVTISSATSAASIRYTTDGSTPTETHGTLYSGPVSLGPISTLKAIAYESGIFADSTVTSGNFVFDAVAPVFSPAAGTYTSVQTVTITSSSTGASIRYTTDGSTPTETNGTLYSVPVAITSTTALQAVAFESGCSDSAVTSGVYNLNLPGVVSAPAFGPAGGNYSNAQAVVVTSSTNGAAVAYTTDGSTPTESGGSVTHGALLANGGTVTISAPTILNAIAFESGLVDSAVATGSYAFQANAPIFSQAAGTYNAGLAVAISSTSNGASIAYTTDGSLPTESGGSVTHGLLYGSPVAINSSTTLNAIAFQSGYADSPLTTAAYAFQTAPPVFSPVAGTYSSAQTVAIFSTGPGASVVYTTDGSTPTESGGSVTHGALYGAPLAVNATTTLKAMAFQSGFADSAVIAGVFTISSPQVVAPTFSPGAGTYSSAQAVTIMSTTNGASIAYTTDGSTPTESGGSITHGVLLSNGGAVSVSATTTLSAMAFATGYADSTVASGVYTIGPPQAAAPVFSPAINNSVAITSATGGASIRYTTDGVTVPTETVGTLYSSPVPISTATTLKAVAYKGGDTDSPVVSVTIGIPTITITSP
jgi:uncharacterized repeat protein (TIGR03803 family)